MPAATQAPAGPQKEVKKLVLCFDGTGNSFQGNTGDTNIVKIYDKLDRDDDNQYHYYQPGIGTYDISGGSINKGPIGNFTSSISKTLDSGFATSFDAHVMAGYRFLMRYYDSGDKIYMFGFSRGAFTARFLARMINTVGLLSKGNDEMVPFAYQLYQEYEQAKDGVAFSNDGPQHKRDDQIPYSPEAEQARNKLDAFTSTFCRRDKVYTETGDHKCYTGVKVYFLGIFDCVSSVKVLDAPFGRQRKPVSVVGTAEHVRHAVAADEFRVKFKAALLNQDVRPAKYTTEDVKEVWFPGNHGDVGGGWPARSQKQIDDAKKLGWFRRTLAYFSTSRDEKSHGNVSKDPYQMSDIALSWMIRELEIVGEQEPEFALKWSERLDGFKAHFKHQQALDASRHNTMRFGRGANFLKVLLWNFMDFLPVFPRWELEKEGWKMRTWPPNLASARDIPKCALIHASLLRRLQRENNKPYTPRNNHGDGSEHVLKPQNFILCDEASANKWVNKVDSKDVEVDHKLYVLNQDALKKYEEDTRRVSVATAVTSAVDVETVVVPKPTTAGRRSVANLSKAPAVNVHVQEITA